MKTAEFSYRLPPELIAQRPTSPRDHSRLFIVPRLPRDNPAPERSDWCGVTPKHRHFFDLPQFLKRGDVLVFNDTKVFPARLYGRKGSLHHVVPMQHRDEGGGKIEILLLEQKSPDTWTALLKPGKNAIGQPITFSPQLKAKVVSRANEVFTLRFNQSGKKLDALIDRLGQTPTPPYIKPLSNLKEYQTVYAKHRGSSAAPTAGFHFAPSLLAKLKKQGIQFEYVTLHVGLGTFQPVKEAEIEQHRMHAERYSVTPATWQRLLAAKQSGRRIIAVGTTTCRVLETLATNNPKPRFSGGMSGTTNIFITPGYHFKMADALITNFHLPESTLLMLVVAFIGDKVQPGADRPRDEKNPKRGIDLTREIYQEAIKRKYRFYSFGDAMLIA